MIKVLFICLGNICRSTMAQSLFTHMVAQAHLSDQFEIDSAATSREEIGNSPHYGTVNKLRQEGIPVIPHRARQMTRDDYLYYDYLIGMDAENIRGMIRIAGGSDSQGKIYKLLDFVEGGDVADPWFTGDFDATYRDVRFGCEGFLRRLEKENNIDMENNMKYTTNNEFEHFDFAETHVKDIELGTDYFHIWLDNVKIFPENSCNRDIRMMRTNNLMLTIHDMHIASFVREGVKIYNADGKPTGERPDEQIEEKDYMDILPLFLEGSAYSIEKETANEQMRYTFVVDASDEATYEVVIMGSGDREAWDKFLSLDSM